MANVTYTTGVSTPSLVVSSGGILNSEPPPAIPNNIGVNVPPGYDLMTYQRLASVLYAHPQTPLDSPNISAAPPTPPGHPQLLPGQEHLLHGGLELKEGLGGLGASWPYTMYYPYDTLPAYPFAPGYGMNFDASRRKNATRETTATLKAWLNEHKKNPYPTKGEKIMLAIITKMTLTQVSTWFANARRRLKKENKMTWEPRNKTDEDDDDDDFKDDISDNERRKELDSSDRMREDDSESNAEDRMERSPLIHQSSPARVTTNGTSQVKPRIWSLADMASSSSTPSSSSSNSVLSTSKLFHRPIHFETSPYGRPLPPLNSRLPSPQEALLQVYAKSLGFSNPGAASAFPPLGLGGPLISHIPTGDPLPPTLLSHSFVPSAFVPSSVAPMISRPVATRPLRLESPVFSPIHHTLPGGAKITPASPSLSTSPSPSSPITDV